ncbi:MAG: ABC transporter permease [Gemmatimonadaceae bacterium]
MLTDDLKYAIRGLGRRKGFTAVAVLTLAIGIGANTAIYSVVDATLLRPLPFVEPDRLMTVSLTTPPNHGAMTTDDMDWSYPKFEMFRREQRQFTSLSVWQGQSSFSLTGINEAERVRGETVGGEYLRTLGVRPALGRDFTAEEDQTSETHLVAILGFDLWSRDFGRDPQAIGRSVALNARTYRIVGVAPRGFRGLSGSAQLFVPVHTQSTQALSQRWSHQWSVIARLKPGVTAAQARSMAAILGKRIDEAYPDPMPNGGAWGAKARTVDEARVDPAIRQSVLVLFGAVAFVLLIACVNIANLLLARASSRRKEIAVRLALGASAGRLVRQLLTESVVLALAGGVGGIGVAMLGVRVLGAVDPATGSSILGAGGGFTAVVTGDVRVSGATLGFALLLSLVTGVLFGLAPALQATRASVTEAMKGGGAATVGAGGVRALTGRNILIVAEFALALVLLVGAGLMLKSLDRLLAARTGIDAEHVQTFGVSLPSVKYRPRDIPRDSVTPGQQLFAQLTDRVAALPGVTAAGLSSCAPLSGGCNETILFYRDRETPKGAEAVVGVHFVSPGFFSALRVPLKGGRMFAAADGMKSPKVVVINEAMAKRFFPGENPIGKPIGVGVAGFDERDEIVGIVGDIKYDGLDQPTKPDVFISTTQMPATSLIMFVRGSAPSSVVVPAIRRELASLDKDLPMFDVLTMRDRIGGATTRPRYSAMLFGTFAAVALVLSAIGIYGVMSYAVTQRSREIGIRMALGADRSRVLGMIVGRGMSLAAIGAATGALIALAGGRVLTSMLYEVKPTDPVTFSLVAALLGVVALVASAIPARRATRVDPLSVMRAE